VTKFIADLRPSFTIQTLAATDGRMMLGDLPIAFAIRGAFEAVLIEDALCGTDYSSLEIEVTFVRCKQVASTVK